MSRLHRPWKINGFWSQQSGGPLESRWFSLAPLVGTPWFKRGMVDVMQRFFSTYQLLVGFCRGNCYLKQLPLSWSKPSTVIAWTVQFQRGWLKQKSYHKGSKLIYSPWNCLSLCDVWNASRWMWMFFYKCYCPTMDGYRWNHSWKSQKLAGNGRAVVVASDIFGIHTGRHKEICDSIAEEVTHGWCEGSGFVLTTSMHHQWNGTNISTQTRNNHVYRLI